MNTFIMTMNDVNFVMDWFEQHKDQMPKKPPRVFKELKVKIKSHMFNITEKIINIDKDIYNLKTYDGKDGKLIIETVISYLDTSETILNFNDELFDFLGIDKNKFLKDFSILEKKSNKRMSEEEEKKLITLMATLHYSIYCFFTFYKPEKRRKSNKSVLEDKKSSNTDTKKSRDKSSSFSDSTIYFYDYIEAIDKGKRYIIDKNTKRKINFSFGVRGHYRHYKNGKIIWISEYTKGNSNNKKGSTYKIKHHQ